MRALKQSKDNKASDVVQSELLMEFFKKNPNRDVSHPEVVDWVTAEYLKRTGKVFRDPDRAFANYIRQGTCKKLRKEFIGTTLSISRHGNWMILHLL